MFRANLYQNMIYKSLFQHKSHKWFSGIVINTRIQTIKKIGGIFVYHTRLMANNPTTKYVLFAAPLCTDIFHPYC